MITTEPSPRRARPERPERLDLDERPPLLRDIWQESARSVVRQLVTGEPDAPAGARLAPTPEDADPILGHLRMGRTDPLMAFLRWRHEKGDVVRLRLAGVTAHLLSHPRHVRWVLQEGNKRFTKPMQGRRNLSQVLGNGLLVSEGSFWLRQRRSATGCWSARARSGSASGASPSPPSTRGASGASAIAWSRPPPTRPRTASGAPRATSPST
jgi:hypothetical protein